MSSKYNISAIQGNTLLLSLTAKDSNGTPINLTGYSARGYVKYQYSDTGRILNLNPLIHQSFTSGIVNISGNSSEIALMPVGEFVYDLEVYDSGNYVTKFLNGKFIVDPEVTF